MASPPPPNVVLAVNSSLQRGGEFLWRNSRLTVFSSQKGAGYHLDLFWVAILMVICSFMGLPWYVAATVISIAHIDSLKMETQTSAPGEQPKFLGVRRVNADCF